MKKIPLGAWIFAGILIIVVVAYQASVRIPEKRMEEAANKVAACTAEIARCHKQSENAVQTLLHLGCIDTRLNSRADMDAAVAVLKKCQERGGEFAECNGYYLNRLFTNCSFAHDSAGIESETKRLVDECISKLYGCK